MEKISTYWMIAATLLFFQCDDVVVDPTAENFIVTASGENVTIDPASEQVIAKSETATFTVTTDDDHVVSQTVDGTCPAGTWDDETYETGEITEDCTVVFSGEVPGPTTIEASVDSLVLSVTGLTLNGEASGTTRTITITNVGFEPTMTMNVFPLTSLPTGTTMNTTCDTKLLPSASCTIDIIPGATPSSAAGDTDPDTLPFAIEADNTNTLGVNVYVLTYGSVFQSGYVFSMDETTLTTQSIGGKVVSLSDASPELIWSSDGGSGDTGDAIFDNIAGILDTSINPPDACDGNTDGVCNTNVITAFYPLINTSFYAAGLCSALTTDGYTDWYLPAICEMGYDTIAAGSGCGTALAPSMQNIESNLVNNGNIGSISGFYWSSTEVSGTPASEAWWQRLDIGFDNQSQIPKNNELQIRCVRSFTE